MSFGTTAICIYIIADFKLMSRAKLDKALLVKTITLMGLGNYDQGSGMSAARFLIGRCRRLIITDLKNAKDLARQITEIKKLSVRAKSPHLRVGVGTKIIWHLGGHQKQDFIKTNLVVRNPDVPWYSPFLALARRKGIPIYNDVTLFLLITGRSRNLQPTSLQNLQPTTYNLQPTIGVTGTRGKSTTAALIYEMVKRENKQARLAGNIGQSPLNYVIASDPAKAGERGNPITPGLLHSVRNDPWVLELSSFLLHDFAQIKYSPNIAVWTNFYPDHLNKYKGLKDYFVDKANIFKYQQEGDAAIVNADDLALRKIKTNKKIKVYFFSIKKAANNGAFIKEGWFCFSAGGRLEKIAKVSETKLLGEHNQANILAAIAAAKAAGVSSQNISAVIKKWGGLPNRLELVREVGGVKWFNDCTATSPEAAIAALKSFPARKIILISGGNSKGSDLKELGQTIGERVKELILAPGDANQDLLSKIQGAPLYTRVPLVFVSTIAAAVRRAALAAAKGDVVLLSPGLTWLPRQNEFARGQEFIKLVEKIN